MIIFWIVFITSNITFISLLIATTMAFKDKEKHKLFMKALYAYIGVGFVWWLLFYVFQLKPYNIMDNSWSKTGISVFSIMQIIWVLSTVYVYTYYLTWTILKTIDSSGKQEVIVRIWVFFVVNLFFVWIYTIPFQVGDLLHGWTYILGDGTIDLKSILNFTN